MMDHVQRGFQQAEQNQYENERRQFGDALRILPAIAREAYDRPAAWQRYERAYGECLRLAQALASRGEDVSIPEKLKPAAPVKFVRVSAPIVDDTYRETAGKGPSGKGLPESGPGSNQEWLETAATSTITKGGVTFHGELAKGMK